MKSSICPLIIFDLDGVLVDSEPIHRKAINLSLQEISEKFLIKESEFKGKYQGKGTKEIFASLSKEKGLPQKELESLFESKEKILAEIINNEYREDDRILEMLKKLKEEEYIIYCASNATSQTIENILSKKGILQFMDYFISAQDMGNPKPDPAVYKHCISREGLSPSQCLIIEDSPSGKRAAIDSGAHLCEVKNPQETTYERIRKHLEAIEKISLIS